MDPDKIAILNLFRNSLGEQAISFRICVPCRLIECDLARVIVKQWPKDGVFEVIS
jgi:hypothetical protein